MLGAKAPPTGAEIKKAAPFKGIHIFATIKACRAYLEGLGAVLRPRQEAVNISSVALYEGIRACPPYIPPARPQLFDAPWATQGPARERAAAGGEVRQRISSVKTGLSDTGQPAHAYLRYVVAGEIAGARAKFGGPGAMLTNLAHLQNMETTCFRDAEYVDDLPSRTCSRHVAGAFSPGAREPPAHER